MRAIEIDRFGGPDVLHLVERADPDPGAGEVVIDVAACGLNHLDVDVREGTSRFPIEFPFVLGLEVVGRIRKVGPEVSNWSVGDRVMPKLMNTCHKCEYCITGRESLCDNAKFIGLYYGGGFAEQVCCSEWQLIRVPESISDSDAAALQISFATAWHMLFTRGHLQVGETVLINSVGSGVGSAALTLARLAGAVTIGSASNSSTLKFAETLGLDIGINYAEEDLPKRVRSVTGGRGVDLVIEHVGGDLFQQSLQCMAKDARLVTCGAHSGEVVPIDVIELFRGQHSIIGSFVYTENELRRVLDLASEGSIKPVIHATFGLEDARLAMESLEARTHCGKVILVP